MSLNNIAIISPGDMGSAIGRLLVSNGANVYTCLANRSTRTKALAEQAGIIDLPTFNDLVRTVDVVLSITVSEIVGEVCQQIATAAKETQSYPIFRITSRAVFSLKVVLSSKPTPFFGLSFGNMW